MAIMFHKLHYNLEYAIIMYMYDDILNKNHIADFPPDTVQYTCKIMFYIIRQK